MLVASVAGGRYQIVGRSLMSGRLAIRLRSVRLRAPSTVFAIAPDEAECVLGGGERATLFEGEAGGLDAAVTYSVEAESEATPLDQPGRSMYREWAWLRRPTEIDLIDAELVALDALVPCRALGVSSVARPPQQAAVTEDHHAGD